AGWGTGKFEARPDQSLRRPLASAVHQAVRELGPAGGVGDHALGVVRSFAQREPMSTARGGRGAAGIPGGTRGRRSAGAARDRWNPGITVPSVPGRADSGDVEIDLVELLSDIGGMAADTGRGIAVFVDEMQDLGPDDVSALCAAAHEIGQSRLPVIVVGAGLPHLPAVLSASKSYSERLFRYARIDRLDRAAADAALARPAAEEDAEFDDDALAAMYAATGGYPYFIQAYGKAVWDVAPRSPIAADDVAVAAAEAEAELAVGFFGSRFERATPGEREYLRAMADVAAGLGEPDAADAVPATSAGPSSAVPSVGAIPTADVAAHLGRKPQSLSPARDGLLKKGLIYSGERGRIAFTVPHFGRYLRDHTA
ncbi:MAG: ATP-binding protein, partial [Dermatophilaceae bacterium]